MHRIYCLPGLGTDERLFKNLRISNCELKVIKWITPHKNEKLKDYALRLAEQIDTFTPFALLGVSFGGMCAVEIAKTYRPEKLILISSAKTPAELPMYIRMFRYLPLHKILPEKLLKRGSRFVKNFFGRLDKTDTKLLLDMLATMPKGYIPNAIDCVLKWDNKECPQNVIHIHGDKDRVIRLTDTKNAIGIKGGTHFMILQKGEKISKVLEEILNSVQKEKR